jgi:G3E family GTPase
MTDTSQGKALSADDLRRQTAGRETLAMLTGIFEAARLIPAPSETPASTLPLTIISGFLGAGKTTLVNRLLSEPHGRRLAVLVNDFGSINIDEELIRSRNADTIGLTNGCACCSVSGDLTKALLRLLAQPDPPDAIVLEASGLADPHGIAQVALANPSLRLDGVLTLVDGETFIERLTDPATTQTVSAQIAAADLIVLNKMDLIAGQDGEPRERLRELAGSRTVIEVSQADVPADVVLGVDARHSGFQCVAEGHASEFRSWSQSWDGPLDRRRLSAALAALPDDVVRAKGVFRFVSEPNERFVYQRVGRRGRLEGAAMPEGPFQSRVVVIGPATAWDENAIAAAFADVAAAEHERQAN